MSEARWFVGGILWLASAGALAAGSERTAVLAVGKCDEASAIAARSFRSALAAKPGTNVMSEADTALPFGGETDKTLTAVTGAIASARSAFYGGQGAEAKATLQTALDDVQRLPPSESRWAAERDALTLLAQVLQKTDAKGADAALARVFRIEPDYRPDTGLYPPSFQKFVDKARKAAKKKTTTRLEVSTSPAGKPVYVGGRKVGVGPVSIRVPAGEYRVEADWGHRGMVRTVTVPSAPVELSAAVEGAVYPDGGPCVEATDATAALSRASRILPSATRLLGVHSESSGQDSFMVVTSVTGGGQDVREARVGVQPGAPTSEALVLLAGWAATGPGDFPVEVTKGPGAKPLPVAPVAAAGAAAAGTTAAAATAPVPEATPAPAASPGRDPTAPHFEAAVRAGIGVPLGSAYQNGAGSDQSLSEIDSYTIPIQLDLGVRLGGSWFLGGYFSYGFAGSNTTTFCSTSGDCSPSTLRVGGEVHWHPLGSASIDPWIGIGSGYEKVSVSSGSGTSSLSGWEFGNLQLGLDFALGSLFRIGPWVSFSIGQYGTASGPVSGVGVTVDLQNKTIHEWLMGGVRLVILP
ncbi:MAG: PEGA domain-containing protein [Myxococcaceae bacterium]